MGNQVRMVPLPMGVVPGMARPVEKGVSRRGEISGWGVTSLETAYSLLSANLPRPSLAQAHHPMRWDLGSTSTSHVQVRMRNEYLPTLDRRILYQCGPS